MLSFVKTVGRHGIEELVKKGYTNVEIAAIYDVSTSTLYNAYRLLYGSDWKNHINGGKAA